MKKISALILLLAVACGLQAQDTQQLKKQIASVKKSSLYLYGEAVAETADAARSLAQDLLQDEIDKYAASKKKLQGGVVVVNNRSEIRSELSLPRGNMYRSFIYVKKSDLIPAANAEVMDATQLPSLMTPSTVDVVYPEAVTILAGYSDYYKMADTMKQLKAEGKVRHYARYENLDNPEKCYLVVYNKQAQVVAVLTPGGQRTNVKTGQPDKVTNYSGCGAIGFTVE